MKITHTRITKLLVEDVEGLDSAIHIVLDATGRKRGLATVRYGSYEWSSFWNAMPQDSIIEFFAKAPTDYLVDEMAQIPARRYDYVSLQTKAISALLKLRCGRDIGREDAREHYDKLHSMERPHSCAESFHLAFGSDWWDCVDTVPNPFYAFAENVFKAAQAAVRQAIASGDLRIE